MAEVVQLVTSQYHILAQGCRLEPLWGERREYTRPNNPQYQCKGGDQNVSCVFLSRERPRLVHQTLAEGTGLAPRINGTIRKHWCH